MSRVPFRDLGFATGSPPSMFTFCASPTFILWFGLLKLSFHCLEHGTSLLFTIFPEIVFSVYSQFIWMLDFFCQDGEMGRAGCLKSSCVYSVGVALAQGRSLCNSHHFTPQEGEDSGRAGCAQSSVAVVDEDGCLSCLHTVWTSKSPRKPLFISPSCLQGWLSKSGF